jgi:hypothetical protein
MSKSGTTKHHQKHLSSALKVKNYGQGEKVFGGGPSSLGGSLFRDKFGYNTIYPKAVSSLNADLLDQDNNAMML